MFGTLFLKECKALLKSITYYIFVACTLFFIVSQMGNLEPIMKPVQGQGDYGYKISTDENVMMQYTLDRLINELVVEKHSSFPIGFYKEVRLDEKEQNKIYDIIKNVTGVEVKEIKEKVIRIRSEGFVEENNIKVSSTITFKEFLEEMSKVDQIIGKGSNYNEKTIKASVREPETYEGAMKVYESIIKDDKFSNAYARIFADYMGIALGLLPVFIAVTVGLKDKRAKAQEVIFSKNISSAKLILARYLAMVATILIPIIAVGIMYTMQSMYIGNSNGITVDYLAFIKVIVMWLLPTILVTLAVGMFFTEMTNGAIGILVQSAWWVISILSGSVNLIGNVGANLMPRFNTVGGYSIYKEVLGELIVNRASYTILAVALIIATIFIYNKKREGNLNINGKILKNS